MTARIHFNELADWSKKPITIYSMKVLENGYELSYGDRAYAPVPKPTPKPEPPPVPTPDKTPVIEPQAQEKAILAEVPCPDCGAMKPENEPCHLCESLARAAALARQARRDWARRNRP